MKEQSLWELKWGRATAGTALIVADSFYQAATLAVEFIKDAKPEWKNVDVDDIQGLKRCDQTVIVFTAVPPEGPVT